MNQQRKSRGAWLALPLAVLALGLAACGPAAQPAAPQAPAADEKPQYGGTLVYGGLSAPSHLDVLIGGSTGDNRNSNGIYDKLVDFDFVNPHFTDDYKTVPGIAERWEMSPDGKTYTFFLHKGVKWHDGEDFTAADVVYTFQRMIEIKSPLAANLDDMEKIEAVDPYTVKLTNKAANVIFLVGLAGSNMGIQPKHLADKGVDLKKAAIGTGPFKLESFDPKSHTVWVKNPNYWQEGRPYIDKVDLIWSLDKPAMLAAVAIGKVDTTYSIEKIDVDTVRRNNPNVQVIKYLAQAPNLTFNIEQPPFNDIRVRRAIHLAIDRQESIKILWSGDGYLNCYLPGSKTGWCIPGMEQLPGFRQPKDQDIAEAKRLLAEAGYPNGFEFRSIYSTAYTRSIPWSELMATQMARIGLKMVIDGRDSPTYTDISRKGTYETIFAPGTGWADTTVKTTPLQWFSTTGVYNKHGFSNAEFDKLIDQQAVTFDVEARKKMWQRMEQIVLDNVWSIPLTDPNLYGLVQPWVKGPMVLTADWQSTYLGTPRWATMWLDQKLLPQR